jgi:hypothetical protein
VKKFIVAIMLVLVTASTSFAVLPVIAYVASAAIHTAVVGGMLWYATQLRDGGSKPRAVNRTSGNIARDANVQWVDLTVDPPVLKSEDVVAKVDFQKMSDYVHANDSMYPTLHGALTVPAPSPTVDKNTHLTNGTVYTYGGAFFKIRSLITDIHTVGNSGNEIRFSGSNPNKMLVVQSMWSATNVYDGATHVYYIDDSAAPAPRPATQKEFAKNIVGDYTDASPGLNVPMPQFSGEIDACIKNNPNIVDILKTPFTDLADAAAKFVGPPAPTASQVANSKIADANASAKTASAGSVAAAQQAYDLSPSPTLLAALNDAKAKQAQIEAQAAKDQKATDTETYSTPGAMTPYKNGVDTPYDFGVRFNTFITTVKTSGLFSLPNLMTQNIPASTTSVISFNGGRYGVQSFDFANYGSAFAVLKTILMICFSAIGIKIITLKGGSG